MSQAKKNNTPKGMSDAEIASRVKKSGSYINLKPPQVVHIVKQLKPAWQTRCFNGSKTVSPLDKVETAGLIAIHGLNKDNSSISKMPVDARRKLIKDAMAKNDELNKFLTDNNLFDRASILVDKNMPGDFSPSNFWALLDEIVTDIDLSNPASK